MEVDEIQTQPQQQQPQPPCKHSRVSSNGRINDSSTSNGGTHNEVVVIGSTANSTRSRRTRSGGLIGEMMVGNNININNNNNNSSNSSGGGNSRFGRQWQPSSRIIRVSRASGGKDRHSKVWTAKGPRDRRVRLSVTTAIQFYDLQDRLGYDQPSKAVEWLIKAASDAINELPCLNTASFPPETPPSRQVSGEERKIDGVLDSMVDDVQQQQLGSKSGCSSNNSETSRGSGGLSLSRSRSEIRVKARERARERTAKEKEPPPLVNVASSHHHPNQQQQQQNVSNNIPQTSSFTQLLTAGMSSLNHSNNKHSRSGASNNNNDNNSNNNNQWLSSGSSAAGQMADYFGTGLIGVGNSNNCTSSLPQVMTIASFGSENHNPASHHHQLQHHHHHHQQQPHFPFLSDQHLIQVANAASGAHNNGGGGGGDYNLNFSISSTSNTTSGFNNRGTLQSNSPSLLPYLQRFSAATDGSSLPFYAAAVSSDHQHQFQPPGLQLCYGDPGRQSSDQRGKGKN